MKIGGYFNLLHPAVNKHQYAIYYAKEANITPLHSHCREFHFNIANLRILQVKNKSTHKYFANRSQLFLKGLKFSLIFWSATDYASTWVLHKVFNSENYLNNLNSPFFSFRKSCSLLGGTIITCMCDVIHTNALSPTEIFNTEAFYQITSI